jgi:nitroreductase
MDLNEAVIGRRAVREYTAQAVDEQTIRLLIDAAVRAPSAVNQTSGARLAEIRLAAIAER